MIPKPVVSWSTLASNVRLASGLYRYSFEVNPLDPNEPGSFPTILEIGDWFIDYTGYPFLIEEINGNTITVYDVNERGNGITSAYGPYNNMVGYVYRPLEGAFILTQAQLRKLDPSAIDVIQNIEKGILWKYRGIKIQGEDEILNITNLELENAEIVDINNDGWQGGKKVKLRLPSNDTYTKIYLESHGFDNDVVYYDSINKVWSKAIASNEETCGSHFAIKIDDNNFIIINNGSYTTELVDEEGNPLISGEYYFLSQMVPGKLTKVQPENGIVQYILQSLENNLIEINIEEPYEKGNSNIGSGVSTFIELNDTPNSYEENKFLYTTIDGITFKSPLISDIIDLENILNTKVELNSDNILTGINTFNNDVYLNSNLYLQGIQEEIKSKILYYDPTTNLISYGNAPSGIGGIPASPIKTIQFNDNGNFGATNFYYDSLEDKYGVFADPAFSDSLFTIDTGNRGEFTYYDTSYFKVKGFHWGQIDNNIFEVSAFGIGTNNIYPINGNIIRFFSKYDPVFDYINIDTSSGTFTSMYINLKNTDYTANKSPGLKIGNNYNVFKTAQFGVKHIVYNNDVINFTTNLDVNYTYFEGDIVILITHINNNETYLFRDKICFFKKDDGSLELLTMPMGEYPSVYINNLNLLNSIYGIKLHVIELTSQTYRIYLKKESDPIPFSGLIKLEGILNLNCYNFEVQHVISPVIL